MRRRFCDEIRILTFSLPAGGPASERSEEAIQKPDRPLHEERSDEWCGRSESNRHTLRYQILSLARLPVPPRPHRLRLLAFCPCFVHPFTSRQTPVNWRDERSRP